MLTFAASFVDRDRVGAHYLHLGERQHRLYVADRKLVALKKLFCSLRPATMLRWLRCHPEAVIAPMHFPTAMEECEPPDEVLEWTCALIASKAKSRELGVAPTPNPIARFIENEFAEARAAFGRTPTIASPLARAEAEALFRNSVRRLGAA